MNNKELIEKCKKIFCSWCPHDCQGLTDEERSGCLASDGFADEAIPIICKEVAEEIYKELMRDLFCTPLNVSWDGEKDVGKFSLELQTNKFKSYDKWESLWERRR